MPKRIVKALSPVLLLALLSACGDDTPKDVRYTESGKALLAAGNIEKAKVEFGNALQINPKNVDARYQLALIAEKQANYNGVFKLLESIVADQPSHVEAQAKLGQIFLARNDLAKAEEQAEIAGRLDASNAETLLLEGNIALRKRDFATAEARARALLASMPDNVNGAILLALAQRAAGHTAEALATLDQAIARNPAVVRLHLIKVDLMLADHRLDDAVAAFRALIAAKPDTYEHRYNLAVLFLRNDRPDEAEAVLREAVAAGVGGDQAKLQLVQLIIQQRGREAAEAELARLIKDDPKDAVLRLRLADLYLAGDKAEQGEQLLQQIVDEDSNGPNGIAARVALARHALSGGDRDRAAQLIVGILERAPANGDALLMRAQIALDRNEADAAIVDLRTVLRDDPKSKRALEMLADAYTKAGTPLLAEDALQRLIEIDPNDPAAKQRLALLKAEGGNKRAAIALLDEVTKQNPDSKPAALSLQAKAGLLLSQGNWSEAEATLRQLGELKGWKPRALLITGLMAMDRGQPDAAVAAFEQAYDLNTDNMEPVNALVQVQLSRGKAAEAATFLDRVLKKTPDNPVIWNFKGETEMARRDWSAAEAAFEKARALQPDWPLLYLNLARAYTEQGDMPKALTAIEAGLKVRPNSFGLLAARGEAEVRLGRIDDAITTFLALAEANPSSDSAANNAAALIADYRYTDPTLLKRAGELIARIETSSEPTLQDTVGWVFYRLGDLNRARQALLKAATALPGSAVVQYHYGMVLAQLGEAAAAREALKTALADTTDFTGRDEARAMLATLSR